MKKVYIVQSGDCQFKCGEVVKVFEDYADAISYAAEREGEEDDWGENRSDYELRMRVGESCFFFVIEMEVN